MIESPTCKQCRHAAANDTAHWKGSASTILALAMSLTVTADDNSCVNSTKDGAGTIVTHTCSGQPQRHCLRCREQRCAFESAHRLVWQDTEEVQCVQPAGTRSAAYLVDDQQGAAAQAVDHDQRDHLGRGPRLLCMFKSQPGLTQQSKLHCV